MATTIAFAGLIPAVRHATRQVIDLTLDSDNDQLPAVEPPRKRARLDATPTAPQVATTTGSQGSLDFPDYKSFHSYIVSRIRRRLDPYPPREQNALGERLMRIFFEDASFTSSVRAAGWVLTPERVGWVEARISSVIGSTQEQQAPTPIPCTIPPLAPKPLNTAAPWSPSTLAHRPSPEARRASGSQTHLQSTSPVPLPVNALKHQQSRPTPPTGLQQSTLSFLARNASPLPQSLRKVDRTGPGSRQIPSKTQAGLLSSSIPHVQTPSAGVLKHGLANGVRLTQSVTRRAQSSVIPISKPLEVSTRIFSRKYGSLQKTVEIKRSMQAAADQETTRKPLPGQQGSETPRAPPARVDIGPSGRRPYLLAKDRRNITKYARRQGIASRDARFDPMIYHVDMTDEELRIIEYRLGSIEPRPIDLAIIRNAQKRAELAPYLSPFLRDRTVDDVRNFLQDLPGYDATRPQLQTSVERDDFIEQHNRRDRRLNTSRLAREMDGASRVSACMSQLSLQTEAYKNLDDSLSHVFASFNGCSGNVTTMSWVSDASLLCGATSTMDTRTIDHNKSGNLVLYSTSADTLRSFKDHREARQPKEGEAPDLSRAKWLYPSVVASATDTVRGLAFTASFDKSVKIWKVEDGLDSSMSVLGTWPHEGKVNFVEAAVNGAGLVATAADVSSEAVRVYSVKQDDPGTSTYRSFSCPRHDDIGNDEWAYWPSTLQWGTAPSTQHLLAVGYSPRSRDGDENQIPEDKRCTGAILLWDSKSGNTIPVYAPTMANVFEVVWHPTLPFLIVSTSRSGLHVTRGVRTQVRIWKQDPDRMKTDQGWHEYKTLDCTAEDINELTVMPNSAFHAYITASCTSGEVFVWDTARGDRPIHVLRHGPMIEPAEDEDDRRRRDVGVKFTAWGHTPDRLFTGSSDGKVNVWNVRKPRPFIRTIMEGEGAIFCGAFSPDRKILAIGDEPGNVWFLADPDEHIDSWGKAVKKRHVPIIVESEDENDSVGPDSTEDANYPRKRYLDTGELLISGNAVVGVVQGPSYHNSIHFERKSHLNEDPSAPLIPSVERRQQNALRATPRRRKRVRRLKSAPTPTDQIISLHVRNRGKDLDLAELNSADLAALKHERVEFDPPEEDFAYESDFLSELNSESELDSLSELDSASESDE